MYWSYLGTHPAMILPRSIEVNPDGVPITIDLRGFVVGASVYIPSINTTKAVKQLLQRTPLTISDIAKRVIVQNGRYGVRVWRLS